jgi:hypothetical protein
VKAGARFLDVNVDEVSTKLDYQLEAMRWLVRELAPLDNVRLSIDSSNLEIISAGITEASQAAGTRVGPPMLNSASLERIEALDLAAQLRGPVVVTAAGESGMPTDAEGRVLSASRMVEASLAAGILLGRIFVDPLVFPSTSNGLWPRTGRAARSKSPSTFSPVSMRTVGRTRRPTEPVSSCHSRPDLRDDHRPCGQIRFSGNALPECPVHLPRPAKAVVAHFL